MWILSHKKHRLNLRIHHRGALSWSRVGASIHSLSPRCLPLQFLLMIQEQIVVARKSSVPTPAARKQMDFAAGQAFYILPHNFSTRWKYILYSLFTKRMDKADVAGTLIRRIRLYKIYFKDPFPRSWNRCRSILDIFLSIVQY